MITLAALDIAGTTVDEGGAVYRALADTVAGHGTAAEDGRTVDVRAGHAADAGMVIGVLTGAQTRDELEAEHPTHVLAGARDIPDHVGTR